MSLTTAAMVSGCMAGSSPWRLRTTSKGSSRASSTAATRSVPEGRAGSVITTWPSKSWTALWIRSSSVATTTWSTPAAARAASQAHWIMGLPAMRARGLPGKRVAAKREGSTARVFTMVNTPVPARWADSVLGLMPSI